MDARKIIFFLKAKKKKQQMSIRSLLFLLLSFSNKTSCNKLNKDWRQNKRINSFPICIKWQTRCQWTFFFLTWVCATLTTLINTMDKLLRFFPTFCFSISFIKISLIKFSKLERIIHYSLMNFFWVLPLWCPLNIFHYQKLQIFVFRNKWQTSHSKNRVSIKSTTNYMHLLSFI